MSFQCQLTLLKDGKNTYVRGKDLSGGELVDFIIDKGNRYINSVEIKSMSKPSLHLLDVSDLNLVARQANRFTGVIEDLESLHGEYLTDDKDEEIRQLKERVAQQDKEIGRLKAIDRSVNITVGEGIGLQTGGGFVNHF